MKINYDSGNFSGSFDSTDLKLLEYEIVDSDVVNWFKNAFTSKVSKSFKKMQMEWTPKLINDSNVSAISASRGDYVNQVTSRSDYLNASGSAAL